VRAGDWGLGRDATIAESPVASRQSRRSVRHCTAPDHHRAAATMTEIVRHPDNGETETAGNY